MHRHPHQGISGAKPRIPPGPKVSKEVDKLNKTYLRTRNEHLHTKMLSAQMELARERELPIEKRLFEQQAAYLFVSLRQRIFAVSCKLARTSMYYFPGRVRSHFSTLSIRGVTFCSFTGGHWVVLQTVAWAQMLHDYSKSAPITEAIERTFSGDYPYTMCIKISEGQQKEEKAPATLKLGKKTEVFLPSTRDLPGKPDGMDFSYLPWAEMALAERSEAPPAPIPILAWFIHSMFFSFILSNRFVPTDQTFRRTWEDRSWMTRA